MRKLLFPPPISIGFLKTFGLIALARIVDRDFEGVRSSRLLGDFARRGRRRAGQAIGDVIEQANQPEAEAFAEGRTVVASTGVQRLLRPSLELVPMWAIYEGSIWLAVLAERRASLAEPAVGT